MNRKLAKIVSFEFSQIIIKNCLKKEFIQIFKDRLEETLHNGSKLDKTHYRTASQPPPDQPTSLKSDLKYPNPPTPASHSPTVLTDKHMVEPGAQTNKQKSGRFPFDHLLKFFYFSLFLLFHFSFSSLFRSFSFAISAHYLLFSEFKLKSIENKIQNIVYIKKHVYTKLYKNVGWKKKEAYRLLQGLIKWLPKWLMNMLTHILV